MAQTWYPFTNGGAREPLLKAICVLAEGTAALSRERVTDPVDTRMCIAAVFADPLQRIVCLGGRVDMPRSIGSLYGGLAALFLGTTFTGTAKTTIGENHTNHADSWQNGVAVALDGATLLVARYYLHRIHAFCIADGTLLRIIGGWGELTLRFSNPRELCVANDGLVFVADCGNNRVQILTPQLDFASFVGVGQLRAPSGVCADSDIVAVSEFWQGHIKIFSRHGGALLRQFSSKGPTNLANARTLCFMTNRAHIAAVDEGCLCVSVFSTEGQFICDVSLSELKGPMGIACSNAGELFVTGGSGVAIYSASGGGLLRTIPTTQFCSGVAVHGGAVFAQGAMGKSIVFT
jgi:hypothetical protein